MSVTEFTEAAADCHRAGSLAYTHLVIITGAVVTIDPTAIVWLSRRLQEIAGADKIGAIAVVVDGLSEYGQLRMLSSMVSDVCRMTVHRSISEAIDELAWTPAVKAVPVDASAVSSNGKPPT